VMEDGRDRLAIKRRLAAEGVSEGVMWDGERAMYCRGGRFMRGRHGQEWVQQSAGRGWSGAKGVRVCACVRAVGRA
jgi:hypothetical protein